MSTAALTPELSWGAKSVTTTAAAAAASAAASAAGLTAGVLPFVVGGFYRWKGYWGSCDFAIRDVTHE